MFEITSDANLKSSKINLSKYSTFGHFDTIKA